MKTMHGNPNRAGFSPWRMLVLCLLALVVAVSAAPGAKAQADIYDLDSLTFGLDAWAVTFTATSATTGDYDVTHNSSSVGSFAGFDVSSQYHDAYYVSSGGEELYVYIGTSSVDVVSGPSTSHYTLVFLMEDDDSFTGTTVVDVRNEVYGGGGIDTIDTYDGSDVIWGDDWAGLTSNPSNDTIDAGGGEDIIEGGPGDDVMFGGDNDDMINAGAGIDWVFAGDGDDRVWGGPGNNAWLDGQGGNDWIVGGHDGNGIYGGDGDDCLYGGDGADGIYGDSETFLNPTGYEIGDDTIDGGGGSDFLYDSHSASYWNYVSGDYDSSLAYSGSNPMGNPNTQSVADGSDSIWLFFGSSFAFGGGGDDTFFDPHADYSSAWAWIECGTGNDTVDFESSNTSCYIDCGSGYDDVYCGSGYDAVLGGSGDDLIRGGAGDDDLYGGDGDDSIDGGSGLDLIYGGAGGATGTNWLHDRDETGGDELYDGTIMHTRDSNDSIDYVQGGVAYIDNGDDTTAGVSSTNTSGDPSGYAASGGYDAFEAYARNVVWVLGRNP